MQRNQLYPKSCAFASIIFVLAKNFMEGLERFELPCNRFVVCRVIHLRYRPSKLVGTAGFEPATT